MSCDKKEVKLILRFVTAIVQSCDYKFKAQEIGMSFYSLNRKSSVEAIAFLSALVPKAVLNPNEL
jgi:hypothetical protein